MFWLLKLSLHVCCKIMIHQHCSVWNRNHTECILRYPLNNAGLSGFYLFLMESPQVSLWVLLLIAIKIKIKHSLLSKLDHIFVICFFHRLPCSEGSRLQGRPLHCFWDLWGLHCCRDGQAWRKDWICQWCTHHHQETCKDTDISDSVVFIWSTLLLTLYILITLL